MTSVPPSMAPGMVNPPSGGPNSQGSGSSGNTSRNTSGNGRTSRVGRVMRTIEKYPRIRCGVIGVVAGGAALLTGYSILKDGYEKGMRNAKERLGQYYADLFVSTNSSPRYSHLFEGMRKSILDFKFDDSVYPAFVRTKNVIFSTLGEIPNNLLSIGLTAGAAIPLIFKGMRNSTTGIAVSAISAGLLLAEGTKNFVKEFFNAGKKSL